MFQEMKTATERYNEQIEEANSILADIKELVDYPNHQIDWSHVGQMGALIEYLKDARMSCLGACYDDD